MWLCLGTSFRLVVIKCFGNPLSSIISHNCFRANESNASYIVYGEKMYFYIIFSLSFQELLVCNYDVYTTTSSSNPRRYRLVVALGHSTQSLRRLC
jgi:hypothetical protein